MEDFQATARGWRARRELRREMERESQSVTRFAPILWKVENDGSPFYSRDRARSYRLDNSERDSVRHSELHASHERRVTRIRGSLYREILAFRAAVASSDALGTERERERERGDEYLVKSRELNFFNAYNNRCSVIRSRLAIVATFSPVNSTRSPLTGFILPPPPPPLENLARQSTIFNGY